MESFLKPVLAFCLALLLVLFSGTFTSATIDSMQKIQCKIQYKIQYKIGYNRAQRYMRQVNIKPRLQPGKMPPNRIQKTLWVGGWRSAIWR
ncbi:MAG: hypothetical protein HC780_26555 [Leptolyngbyaceae cyanobacterium CSU_1_3]|nr:hypothetical protein [Leptolyngbyaceae cyanobacterium CSU_1_3]